MLAKYVFHLLL